jgi:hypothetical protein
MLNKKSGSVDEAKLKAILIIGEGFDEFQTHLKMINKEYQEELSGQFLIIGDGINPLSKAMLSQLKGRIDKSTRIDVLKKKWIDCDECLMAPVGNRLKLSELCSYLNEYAGTPLQVHVWGCCNHQCSEFAHGIKSLGEGSFLIKYAGDDNGPTSSIYTLVGGISEILEPLNNNLPVESYLAQSILPASKFQDVSIYTFNNDNVDEAYIKQITSGIKGIEGRIVEEKENQIKQFLDKSYNVPV